MVLFNYSTRELTAKIVYYGPGLCGKTTNLQYVHENLPESVKGKMLSLATKTDRTLFFDFLPIDLGEIRGMKTRVQLYTVPGQVFYNETRKLVLKGADGIVFVADSQETMLGPDVESFRNLEENLKAHGMRLQDMPHVIQFNKRDLPRLASIEDLNAAINKYNAPFYESVATTGIGVQDTLKAIVKLVLLHLTRKYDPKSVPAEAERKPAPVVAQPAPVPAVARPAAARSVPLSSVPVSEFEENPAIAPAPVVEARRTSPPPPPNFRTAEPPAPEVAEPGIGDFDAAEIDGIMSEVEEAYAPEVVAEPEPAAVEEVGVWMGGPEEEAAFGSTLSLDELETMAEDRAPAPAPAPVSAASTPAEEESFELDGDFGVPAEPEPEPEPERVSAPVRIEVRGPEPEPEPVAEIEPDEVTESEVVLTEVASDDDLFADPELEVARLDPGDAREIVVPVQLGEGRSARRFKLTIRLRVDAVD